MTEGCPADKGWQVEDQPLRAVTNRPGRPMDCAMLRRRGRADAWGRCIGRGLLACLLRIG